VFGARTKPGTQEIDNFWQLINYNQGKHVFHKLITYMTERRRHRERWVQALQQSCVPLALINGSADPVSGAHMVARFRELVGNCRLLMQLPDIGHYPQLEDPEAVACGCRTFWAGCE